MSPRGNNGGAHALDGLQHDLVTVTQIAGDHEARLRKLEGNGHSARYQVILERLGEIERSITERLARVEASAEAAHKRIDRHEDSSPVQAEFVAELVTEKTRGLRAVVLAVLAASVTLTAGQVFLVLEVARAAAELLRMVH